MSKPIAALRRSAIQQPAATTNRARNSATKDCPSIRRPAPLKRLVAEVLRSIRFLCYADVGRPICAEYGAIRPARELLDSGKKRLSVDDGRRRLNNSYLWIAIHHLAQTDDGFSRHDTVRIEHNHIIIIIACSPPPEKVGNVSALGNSKKNSIGPRLARRPKGFGKIFYAIDATTSAPCPGHLYRSKQRNRNNLILRCREENGRSPPIPRKPGQPPHCRWG